MSTGICDRVGNKVVRKIWIVRIAVECELQHAGAGELKLVAQSLHVGCNQTKILGDER